MIKPYKYLLFALGLMLVIPASGQTISKELMTFYTSQWEGERFQDGRPKVPDEILQRLKKVSI